MADVALLRGGVPLIHCVTTWRPCTGLREVTMSVRTGEALCPQVSAREGAERNIALQHALSLSWKPAFRSATNVAAHLPHMSYPYAPLLSVFSSVRLSSCEAV